MKLNKKIVLRILAFAAIVLLAVGIWRYKLFTDHKRADELVTIGMDKFDVIDVLGKPDGISHYCKNKPDQYLWGPQEGLFSKLKVGDCLEVLGYRYYRGGFTVTFLNSDPKVVAKNFTPKGIVY